VETEELSAPTYYDLLEVEKEVCNERVVKKNYYRLSLQQHPDKGGEISSYHLIREAYEVLSNDEKREKYDKDIDAAKSAKVESDAVIAQAALQAKKAEKIVVFFTAVFVVVNIFKLGWIIIITAYRITYGGGAKAYFFLIFRGSKLLPVRYWDEMSPVDALL
jgi:DnaJ-class molecular chaperone